MNRFILSLVLVPLALAGCVEKFDPDKEEAKIKAQEPKKKSSNIKKITTTVPPGKKVACEDVVDLAAYGAALEDEVGFEDASKTDFEATTVCKIVRGGEPPTLDPNKEVEEGKILGVLPGDALCIVHLYCSVPVDQRDFEERCVAPDDKNMVLDQFSCVHKSQRASAWAYTYKTIHTPTECILKVMGGPSVTDESTVQKCTKVALETITKENLKNFK